MQCALHAALYDLRLWKVCGVVARCAVLTSLPCSSPCPALPCPAPQASYEQLEEVPASVPQGVDEILEVRATCREEVGCSWAGAVCAPGWGQCVQLPWEVCWHAQHTAALLSAPTAQLPTHQCLARHSR